MRTAIVIVAVASLFLVSCAPQQPDMAAVKKAVDDFNAVSKDAMMNGNSDKVMAYYEDNAMQMPPNAPMAKGKDAIKAFMDQMMKSGMKFSEITFATLELDASGKVAYELGTYDMSMSMPSMSDMKDKGKYIAIWRQQPDGSWKVHAEMWNTDMPMPSMDQMMGSKDDMGKDMKKKK